MKPLPIMCMEEGARSRQVYFIVRRGRGLGTITIYMWFRCDGISLNSLQEARRANIWVDRKFGFKVFLSR